MTRCNSERHVGRPAELSEFFNELSIASEILKSAGEKYIQSRWTNTVNHNWEILHAMSSDSHFQLQIMQQVEKFTEFSKFLTAVAKNCTEWKCTPANGCRNCVHWIYAQLGIGSAIFWHQHWLMIIKTSDMSLKMCTPVISGKTTSQSQQKQKWASSMCSQCQGLT